MLGEEFIFLIIMDGASVCIAAMQIIRERYSHILTQRLLLAGICNHFKAQLRSVLQIINFMNNHEELYTSLRDDGATALFHGAETRMAKDLLAAESVLQDKEHLQRLWLSKAMKSSIQPLIKL